MTLGKAAALARVAGWGRWLLAATLWAGMASAHADKPNKDREKLLAGMVGHPAPELDFTVRDGSSRKLSDAKGRWVLLEEGGVWCPPSRETAYVLSEIQDQLKDQPFDFICVYDDPDFADIDLGTPYPFSGIQGIPVGPLPDEWEVGGIPALFLIDPQGKIVWSSGAAWSGQIRTAIAWHTGHHLTLPPDFTQVAPDRLEQEKAAALAFMQKDAEALALYEDLVKRLPEDAAIRTGYAWALDEKKSLAGAAWLTEDLKNPAHATDAERFSLLYEWANAWKFAEAEALLEPLLAKYPDSIRLKALHIVCTKQPEEITPADFDVLLAGTAANMIYPVRYYAAYAAEALGRTAEADAAFAGMNDGWLQQMKIGYLARHGKQPEAVALALALDEQTTPETTDRNLSWPAMFRHATALDWPGAKAYADAHSKVTPWNAGGAVVRLLAAVRTGDAAGKDAAWQELLNFKTDRKAYLFGQKAMTGPPVTQADVAALAGDEHAFVGLLWAGVALEAQGKPEEARQLYGWMLKGLHLWGNEYGTITTIRASLGQAPAAPAAPVGS
jgi:hypothetical protein